MKPFPPRIGACLVAGLLQVAGILHAQNTRPQPDTRKLANAIDREVAAFFCNRKLPVPKDANDETFLRRAFLVTVGRIPTTREAADFLEIEDPTKREQLVRHLVRSPGYSSHMSNWAFDLLRVVDTTILAQDLGGPYRGWIRKAMSDNMPWDEFTTRLLASSGNGWDPGNGAVGYYTRDRGMPLDNLSNSMRIFLGARMECAQCHDDPFGETERHDFYRLAAFTHGQHAVSEEVLNATVAGFEDKDQNSREFHMLRMLQFRIFGLSLAGGGTGRIQLPADYQYRDGKPGEIVGARTPFGKPSRMSEKRDGSDGRKRLADWVVTRNGDRFPGTIANRMWKRIMGTPFHGPADEWTEPGTTHHPRLAKLLVDTMTALDYDLRAFQEVLLLTRTFGFATNPQPSSVENGDDFNGRRLQRLSAEQIWDSLITLRNGNPDHLPPRTTDERVVFDGKAIRPGNLTMHELSRQVLSVKDPAELRRLVEKLTKEADAGPRANAPSMNMVARAPAAPDPFARASEQPSPAPRGHLLHLFGASDRAVVEAASKDTNVSQVLALMNGFVQQELVRNDKARFREGIPAGRLDAQTVNRICLAILGRTPDPQETEWMLAELRERGPEGCRNLVAALVMSAEFLFLR